MTKAELRKQYLNKRKQFAAEELQLKSLQIGMQFFKHFNVENIRYLHVFLPISRQNEIDTWPIIQRSLKNYPSLHIVIPRGNSNTLTLDNYCYTAETKLQTNQWGISEPVNGEMVAASLIEMVIVPLIAFDEKGYRVGYGKGFYDRFLAQCRKETVKVGLSIEAPVPEITDIDQYDIPMDYCITPEKLWEFR